MGIEMVLNEHSLQQAPDIHEARNWMVQFVQTIKTASQHKVDRNFRTTNKISEIHLAKDYPLSKWLNDREVNRDMRQYLGVLTAKMPPWDDLPDLDDQVNAYQLSHTGYNHEAPRVCGLWVSHLVNALAISLPSHSNWDSNNLDLEVQWLEGEDNIQSESVKVIHASHPDHVTEHEDWIEERRLSKIQNGDDLWNHRGDLFPSLTFCDSISIKSQIRGLNQTMLWPVVRRLSELQAHCEEWTSGNFNKEGLLGEPRQEGEATLQKYGKERTFRCPDSKERCFSWHVSINPNAWRLYFFPVPETTELIISYIGPHLRTAKFN